MNSLNLDVTPLAEHDDAVTGLWVREWAGRQAVISVASNEVARVTALDDGAVLCAWALPVGAQWGMSGGPDPLLVARTWTAISGYAADGTPRWVHRTGGAPRSERRAVMAGELWCGTGAFAYDAAGGYVLRGTADGEPLGPPLRAKAMLTSSGGELRALVPVPGGDGVRLIDPVTGERLDDLPWQDGTIPLGLAGPDDRWLLARDPGDMPEGYLTWSPYKAYITGGHVRLWDRESGRWTLTGAAFEVTAMNFSRSLCIAGDWYALTGTGQESHPFWLWRLPRFEPAAELGRTDLSLGPAGSLIRTRVAVAGPDEARVLVTGGGDGRVVRVALPSGPAAMPAPEHEYFAGHDGFVDGSVAVLATEPPMATFQTESNVFEHIWLEELPGPGEPDFHAAFDALYGHTTRVPFARTGVMNGEPVVAVNGRHGFECWSPSSRPWIIETMIPAYDAIIGTCDHDRTVLAAWFFDELAAFHLDDGGPCGDVFKIGPKEGERLALAEGRPVVARLDDHVVLDYDHGYLSDREPSSGYVLLEDDCPSGCYCRWSIVHADDHGRILVAQHAEAIHRYDLATGAHLGAPVTGVRGTPYGARTGRLRDRDVILVMAGTVLSVHDAATGARIERIAAHTRVFDAATPGDGRIVAMTENGPLFHDTDASQ